MGMLGYSEGKQRRWNSRAERFTTVRLSGRSEALPLATLFIPTTDAAAKSTNAIALPFAASSAPGRFAR
jgi:hypothetical protein